MKFFAMLICSFFLVIGSTTAQDIPAAFSLDKNEQAHRTLIKSHPKTLLDAANDDLKVVFEQWLHLMHDIDKYSEEVKFDIKGVRVWLDIFFAADGSIEHIAFILRPDSRNIDEAELRAFFSAFTRKHKLDLTYAEGFHHYSGANFPTLGLRN